MLTELPQHSPSRGFHGSPLTGRTQTGKHGQSRFGTTSKTYKTAAPNAMDSVRRHVEFPTRTGFIQISHSLHIPPQRPSSAKAEKRNKIFDSYMRELTSRAGEKNAKHRGLNSGKANGVMVKSLGGTSGKIVPDHQGNIKPQTAPPGGANGKVKHQAFAVHGGRRSGLAIANEFPTPITPKKSSGNVNLGLHGDPVRLNLDKNIHNIYRDLGILKKPGSGSGPSSPIQPNSVMTYEEMHVVNNGARRGGLKSAGRRRDGSRSRAQSALSGDRVEDFASTHSVVTIPTAANSTHDEDEEIIDDDEGDFVTFKETRNQKESEENVVLAPPVVQSQTSRSANRKPGSAKKVKSNEVVDSGTQCIPGELEPTEDGTPSLQMANLIVNVLKHFCTSLFITIFPVICIRCLGC